QFVDSRRGVSRPYGDKDAAFLAINGIRHGDQACFGNGLMCADQRFNLFTADLLAATVDVVPQSAFKAVIGLAIYNPFYHHVAGSVKAIRRVRLDIGCRSVEESGSGRWTPKTQFAHLPRSNLHFSAGCQ